MVTNAGSNVNVGIIVNKGFEKAAVVQVRDILEHKSVKVEDTIVSFTAKEWTDVYRFIYKNQIANRVIYLICDFDYKDEDELLKKIKEGLIGKNENIFLKDLLINDVDFRASFHVDEHTDVTETEAEIGGILIDYAKTLGKNLKVNLKNPTLNFYIYSYNNHAYVGIDLSGELSKRDYKIFNNAVSLKGTTAFGLLMLAGYKPKDVYLNPCCYSGTIEIEAALYGAQLSPRFYNKSFPFMKLANAINNISDNYWDNFFKKIDDERVDKLVENKFSITGSDKLLSSISAATKNAKIAGVESLIDFRRIDFDWMDIKFEENTVDTMISFIPGSSKNDKYLVKEFKEIFYQAEYILKKSGRFTIMCLSKDLLISSSKEYFDLEHEIIVHSGGQMMYVLSFKKKVGKEKQ
jgi:23S rRNA G2445 N2-methylase RlmL